MDSTASQEIAAYWHADGPPSRQSYHAIEVSAGRT